MRMQQRKKRRRTPRSGSVEATPRQTMEKLILRRVKRVVAEVMIQPNGKPIIMVATRKATKVHPRKRKKENQRRNAANPRARMVMLN